MPSQFDASVGDSANTDTALFTVEKGLFMLFHYVHLQNNLIGSFIRFSWKLLSKDTTQNGGFRFLGVPSAKPFSSQRKDATTNGNFSITICVYILHEF